MSDARRMLFLIRRPPYGGLWAQESLDMILTAAAFDQHVVLLFLDEGVLQLRAGQMPHQPGPKSLGAMFGLLETYGVEQALAERESLLEWGMRAEELVLRVDELPRAAVSEFMAGFDVLISC